MALVSCKWLLEPLWLAIPSYESQLISLGSGSWIYKVRGLTYIVY